MKVVILFLIFILSFSSCKKAEAHAEDMAISVNENFDEYDTIEFYKNVAHEGRATISYGSKIWNAIASGFNGI